MPSSAVPQPLLTVYVLFAGACVGSFLNVVIARLPKSESLVQPRSRCPRCLAPIPWYDNIPILSWLLLRARCRRCKEPISARYPAVELLTGLLALAIVRRWGATPTAVGYFAFAAALIALAYIDLDTWLLPHEITWPLLAIGLASPLWNRELSFRSSILGAVCGFAVFSSITLFGEKVLKRELMGWGDAWLLAGIGAWLGLEALLPVVLLASLQGAAIGGLLLLLRRRHGEDAPSPSLGAAEGAAAADPASPSPSAAEGAAAADAEQPAPVAGEGVPADGDWTPPAHAVPFGPFLALAALEQLLLGPALSALWSWLLGFAT
jgi:leader peptidase (prepilin peptidase)/N-methyltransferase